MKKNLFFVFTMLCALSFFTACSDDDNPEPEVPVLLKGATEFSADKLSLTYGDSPLLGKQITFSTEDGKTATIKMEGVFDPSILAGLMPSSKADLPAISLAPGVIPGEVTTMFTVNLVQEGNTYTFEGTDSNNGREMKYAGTVDSTSMTLAVNVKMPNNDLQGTWKLAEVKKNDLGTEWLQEPVYFAWEAADSFNISLAPGSALKLAAADILGMGLRKSEAEDMLLNVLQDVTFREDGNIVATYSKGANIENPQWTASPLNIAQYTVNGNDIRLFLNIDMVLANIKTKAGIADLPEETLSGIITHVVPMLSDGVPLKYKKDGEKLVAYADTELILKLMNIFLPLLQNENIINALMEKIKNDPNFGSMAPMVQGMLEQLPAVVASTTKLELGLNLEK